MVESEWLEPEGESGGAGNHYRVGCGGRLFFVDLDGESHHEQVEAKLSRRGREMLNEGEEMESVNRTPSHVTFSRVCAHA